MASYITDPGREDSTGSTVQLPQNEKQAADLIKNPTLIHLFILFLLFLTGKGMLIFFICWRQDNIDHGDEVNLNSYIFELN